ncbi:Fic family protein [Heliobacterium gestii]|uniref:Fic family protein n=1 Tax=Heliomicrobium gestii TaxID=2699 RepID=A0A845LJT6_HELGE|nr:Fic family protein [Heliomicrobium gestii]MBM7867409.1 Fic family protein [Heliomicrobium gestii]MZP43673.1 Fic family protein [Heliomicrobium gestii]
MDIYKKLDLYKAAIDALRPFEGELLRELKAYYRIGLTWSSNALEGNTLTESETKVLLEEGLTAGGKPLKDTFEALGHANAYDYMFTLLHNRQITEADALTMHQMFYHNIDTNAAGRYRIGPVFISGSKYAVCKPERIEEEVRALFLWAARERDKHHPVSFAAQLHKRFVFIHPFIDGNGRISRLLMNTALIQDGYMLAIIPPVLRHEYIALLEKAHVDDRPFMTFMAERVLESQKEIMRLLHIPVPTSTRSR